jgi:hypothetical protein
MKRENQLVNGGIAVFCLGPLAFLSGQVTSEPADRR